MPVKISNPKKIHCEKLNSGLSISIFGIKKLIQTLWALGTSSLSRIRSKAEANSDTTITKAACWCQKIQTHTTLIIPISIFFEIVLVKVQHFK